ncbi:hypothetical protein [Streptomyces sp. NPDC050428]
MKSTRADIDAAGDAAAVYAVAVYDSWARQCPKRIVRIHGG